MKTEVKKLEKCQVQLNVTLDADEMKAIVKDVEKAFVREAKLPGFRPGKIPVELIRKEFANGLKQETERMMYQRNIAEAIKAEKLDDVAVADVKDMTFNAEGGSFAAIVEVKPVFKLPTYKGLKLTSNDVTVKDADVDDQIARLRAAYATYEDAKEGDAVAEGDFVQIDYSGTVGGKSILELNPEAKVVASGEGFWTQVEEGRFLPEILDSLKGMKAGETKEGIKAKFDKESAPEGLKGEKAVYTVTLKSFRRRILPDDAQFAEKAKAESFDALKTRSASRCRSTPPSPRLCAARTRPSTFFSRRATSMFPAARSAALWTATSTSSPSARSVPVSMPATSSRTATRS